jgi:hypothetical protein
MPKVNGAAAAALFEAGFKPGVAYIEVPRCDGCRWWRLNYEALNLGDCRLFTVTGGVRENEGSKLEITASNGEAVAATRGDFGCVQFSPLHQSISDDGPPNAR